VTALGLPFCYGQRADEESGVVITLRCKSIVFQGRAREGSDAGGRGMMVTK